MPNSKDSASPAGRPAPMHRVPSAAACIVPCCRTMCPDVCAFQSRLFQGARGCTRRRSSRAMRHYGTVVCTSRWRQAGSAGCSARVVALARPACVRVCVRACVCACLTAETHPSLTRRATRACGRLPGTHTHTHTRAGAHTHNVPTPTQAPVVMPW